ncbi:MAG: hypothetical protein ACLU9S_22845 [Oscillospiraceae bacterium]
MPLTYTRRFRAFEHRPYWHVTDPPGGCDAADQAARGREVGPLSLLTYGKPQYCLWCHGGCESSCNIVGVITMQIQWLYYPQSLYYDPAIEVGLSMRTPMQAPGRIHRGYNMSCIGRNNPASRTTDLFGYADEDAKEKAGQNIENMLAFFGVDSPEELPEMSDDCMVFLENTWNIF